MNSETFYNKYINDDFENEYVPKIFEDICKQYLIRQNKKGELEEIFEKKGKYYYDDPVNKTNGEFDIVTQDDKGYIFYEAKFRKEPITESKVKEEIMQISKSGLECYKYGFISKSGFDCEEADDRILISLSDIYK